MKQTLSQFLNVVHYSKGSEYEHQSCDKLVEMPAMMLSTILPIDKDFDLLRKLCTLVKLTDDNEGSRQVVVDCRKYDGQCHEFDVIVPDMYTIFCALMKLYPLYTLTDHEMLYYTGIYTPTLTVMIKMHYVSYQLRNWESNLKFTMVGINKLGIVLYKDQVLEISDFITSTVEQIFVLIDGEIIDVIKYGNLFLSDYEHGIKERYMTQIWRGITCKDIRKYCTKNRQMVEMMVSEVSSPDIIKNFRHLLELSCGTRLMFSGGNSCKVCSWSVTNAFNLHGIILMRHQCTAKEYSMSYRQMIIIMQMLPHVKQFSNLSRMFKIMDSCATVGFNLVVDLRKYGGEVFVTDYSPSSWNYVLCKIFNEYVITVVKGLVRLQKKSSQIQLRFCKFGEIEILMFDDVTAIATKMLHEVLEILKKTSVPGELEEEKVVTEMKVNEIGEGGIEIRIEGVEDGVPTFV